MSTERIATLKKGGGGVGYRQKDVFLKLQKEADRKRLFCSNVSTLLSMIVVMKFRHFRTKYIICTSEKVKKAIVSKTQGAISKYQNEAPKVVRKAFSIEEV